MSTDVAARAAKEDAFFSASLIEADPEIADTIAKELGRQRDEIELIASENIVSRAVLEAQGSVLTNKYAEGYPGRRYYGGCQFVDVAENIAIELATVASDLLRSVEIDLISARVWETPNCFATWEAPSNHR